MTFIKISLFNSSKGKRHPLHLNYAVSERWGHAEIAKWGPSRGVPKWSRWFWVSQPSVCDPRSSMRAAWLAWLRQCDVGFVFSTLLAFLIFSTTVHKENKENHPEDWIWNCWLQNINCSPREGTWLFLLLQSMKVVIHSGNCGRGVTKTKGIQVEDLPETGVKLIEPSKRGQHQTSCFPPDLIPTACELSQAPGEITSSLAYRAGIRGGWGGSAPVIEWLCSVVTFFWLLFWKLKIKCQL